MVPNNNSADKLLAFKIRNKFSDENWEARGLNPSAPEVSKKMDLIFDRISDNLIQLISQGAKAKQFKSTLKIGIKDFNKSDYDTEEKEFICDLFHEMAGIVNVDINAELNKWLYGSLVNLLQKLSKLKNPDTILVTLEQPCTKCEAILETYIKRKQEGIPDSSWLIAKCNNCDELNLLVLEPNIKDLKFGEYQYVGTLNKDEYTYDQALTRMKQIQFFKK